MSNKNKFYNFKNIEGISIIDYNLKRNSWWKNRSCILLKDYENISGEKISNGAKILILGKMQIKRKFPLFGTEYFIHKGQFIIQDFSFNKIYGVDCYDIQLTETI